MEEPDPYTFYCDVYSFGVVIFELITSQLPYPHVQERDQVTHPSTAIESHTTVLVYCCLSLPVDSLHGGVWFSEA